MTRIYKKETVFEKVLLRFSVIILLFQTLLNFPTTSSYFNDVEESRNNIFAATKLDLELAKTDFTPDPVMPGETSSATVSFSNVGMLDFGYDQEYNWPSGDLDLCSALNVTVKQGANVIYDNLPLEDLYNLASDPLLISSSLIYDYEITIPEDAPATLSNKTCNFKIVSYAWQPELGKSGGGFWDIEEVPLTISTGDWSFGDLVIHKWDCIENTVITEAQRPNLDNSNSTYPGGDSGCRVAADRKFGYIPEDKDDYTPPYLGKDDDTSFIAFPGMTDSNGTLTINDLSTLGRMDLAELDSDGSRVGDEFVLGFLCYNGDTQNVTDNYEMVKLVPNGTTHCNVYNARRKIGGKKYEDLNQNGDFDEGETRLSGWTIFAGELTETLTVSSSSESAVTTKVLDSGQEYLIKASGTFDAGDSITADAKYSDRLPAGEWTDVVETYESEGPTLLDLQLDGVTPAWGEYKDTHEYWITVFGDGLTHEFKIRDIYYPNNVGDLTVKIYKIIDDEITDVGGIYRFDFTGNYKELVIGERMQAGWEQTEPTSTYYEIPGLPVPGGYFFGNFQVPEPTQKIVINEVYYDVLNTDYCNEDNGEWIELYNPTDAAININGWSLADNDGTTKSLDSDVSIPAHGYAVVSHDNNIWTNCWSLPEGTISIQVEGSGPWLANSGDSVFLLNVAGEEVDGVSWGTETEGKRLAFSPAVGGVSENHSISRKPAGFDNDIASDWIDTHSGSTPPGPNPGTNPHDEDGNLLAPTPFPSPAQPQENSEFTEPSPTPTDEPTTTPTDTPTPTATDIILPQETIVENSPTPTIDPEPTATGPTGAEPTPTTEGGI